MTSHHAHQKPWDLSRCCRCFASVPDSSVAIARLLAGAGQYAAARRLAGFIATSACLKVVVAIASYSECFVYFTELSVSDSGLPD